MPLVLSQNGATLAYRLTDVVKKRDRLVIGGAESEEFERAGLPALSPDGSRAAYWVQQGDSFSLVLGAQRTPAYKDVADPVWSQDGRTAVYGIQTEARWEIVCGAKRIPMPSQPTRIFVSDDGSNAGAIVISSRSPTLRFRVVVDGRQSEEWDQVGVPAFAPDGATVAYRAVAGERTWLVVGARKVEIVDFVSDPVWSANGKSLGYGAQIGQELWWRETSADAPQPIAGNTHPYATVSPPSVVSFDDIEPLGVTYRPIYGDTVEVHRAEGNCCVGGRCNGSRSPAVIDLESVFGGIDEYQRAHARSVPKDSAEYLLLIARANERFKAALESYLHDVQLYDTVLEKGRARLRGTSRARGIPDVTEFVKQRIR